MNVILEKSKYDSRDTSIDLLRIICMLFVVLIHTLGWGGLVEGALIPKSANWYAGNIIHALSLQAVNGFVLISGYFLCTSKFKLSRLVSTWGQAFFYSVTIYLVLTMLPNTEVSFSISELIKCGMVVTMDKYWFVTDYILLYITFPFLNYAIKSMDKSKHLMCCLVLVTIFSIIPNIVYISDFSEVNGGYSYIWFCVLYFIAAYFRLYVPKRIKGQKYLFFIFILLSLLICGEKFLAYYITPYIFGRVVLTSLFYSYNSLISIFCAIVLFQCFRGIDIKSILFNKVICLIAPLTFAVYLIHEQDMLRPILWNILDPASMANSIWMVPYVLCCSLCVFGTCILIEFVRQKTFKIIRGHLLIKSVCDKIQNKANMLFDGIIK